MCEFLAVYKNVCKYKVLLNQGRDIILFRNSIYLSHVLDLSVHISLHRIELTYSFITSSSEGQYGSIFFPPSFVFFQKKQIGDFLLFSVIYTVLGTLVS